MGLAREVGSDMHLICVRALSAALLTFLMHILS